MRILVPRVPGSSATDQFGDLAVSRFRFFPRRWEDLADGAIIENIRAKRSRLLQVPFFFLFEALAVRRMVKQWKPDVMHVHWIVPQGIVAAFAARKVPALLTTLGGDVYALNDPVSKRLKRRALKYATAVTTMNSDMREKLVELGAVPSSTSVLPMGAQIGEMVQFAGEVGSSQSCSSSVASWRRKAWRSYWTLWPCCQLTPSGRWTSWVMVRCG